jgi:hypothetical protein
MGLGYTGPSNRLIMETAIAMLMILGTCHTKIWNAALPAVKPSTARFSLTQYLKGARRK